MVVINEQPQQLQPREDKAAMGTDLLWTVRVILPGKCLYLLECWLKVTKI